MTETGRLSRAAFIACAVAAVSFLFDGFAGHIPQAAGLVIAGRVGSFIGNGLFLGAVSIALYAVGLKTKKNLFKDAGKQALTSVILSGAVVNILKVAFERPRPTHASGAVLALLDHPSLFDLTGKFNSMPSGHSTAAFAFAFVASRRFPRLAPLFYSAAVFVAASRVYLGSHYPSDVVIGALAGVVVGWLVTNEVNVWQRWLRAGLIILTVFISFFKSGSYLLFDVDEAVFSEAAREMVETGDYITPTYNYEPRYDKPILYYWLDSVAFKFGGVNEASARAASGVMGVLLTLMTFAFVRRIKGMLPAFFASIALLLNIEFFAYSHSAVVDMTLAFFIAASIYAFYLGVHEDDRRWHAAFWAASALAVLTKGVIGALFPVVVAFIYLAASKKLARIKDVLRPWYILLFFLIVTPWFIAEYSVNGREFFDAFIIKHHIQRYSGVISSHSGPVYFYIGILLIGFFPWVAFVPGALWRAVKDRLTPDEGLRLLAAIWFLFVLVFFTIARTKLPNYIFPLFAPAAILAGAEVARLAESRGGGGILPKGGLYLLIAISVVFGAGLIALPFLNIKMDITLPAAVFICLGIIFLATAALAVYAFRSNLAPVIGISVLAVALIIVIRLYALPPVNIALQKDLYLLSSYAAGCGKDVTLAAYEINKPSIAFYAGRKAAKIEKSLQGGITEGARRGGFLLIAEASRLEAGELSEHKELHTIMAQGKYVLLGNVACNAQSR